MIYDIFKDYMKNVIELISALAEMCIPNNIKEIE